MRPPHIPYASPFDNEVPMTPVRITRPDDPGLDELTRLLAEMSPDLELSGNCWPAEQLRLCGEYGVYEWFLEREFGGQGWSEADLVRGYLRLSAACLTTTFVITQRTGACRRIAVSDHAFPREALLPGLLRGDLFATVGISHLTTSRRHEKRPVLRATLDAQTVTLDGYSPWVTGSTAAQVVVVGATLEDGSQVLVAAATDQPGVTIPPPAQLVGLTASQTGPIEFASARFDRKWLLAGPLPNVMQQGVGAKTGGLQTSTLAIGLADAALTYLQSECDRRPELSSPADELRSQWRQLRQDLLQMAEGNDVCSNEQLRGRANSLVLRSAQAALSAAKGSGYIVGHPAGRWCREALFFLVWSCPQPVMAANLCELAGID